MLLPQRIDSTVELEAKSSHNEKCGGGVHQALVTQVKSGEASPAVGSLKRESALRSNLRNSKYYIDPVEQPTGNNYGLIEEARHLKGVVPDL
jgi:hypothetical protein